jgi:hypothetical protein
MKMLYKILTLCFCILPTQLCFADVIVVDINGTGNFTSIQAAIDNAVSRDTVLVLPGTYFENINYKGKNICLMSKAGPDTTIIDGSQPQDFTYRSVVTFHSGEDSTAILSGFTITGGTGMYYKNGDFTCRMGGGIICGASPIIENNIIRDNMADSGGGIEIGAEDRSPSPIIRKNIFWRNKGHEYDPIWIYGAGAINVWSTGSPIIINNTIINNEGTDMCGGVLVAYTDELLLYNNIIVNNAGGGFWKATSEVWAKVFYDNIWNNIPNLFGNTSGIKGSGTFVGCISADPLFVDPENGDFRLQPGSPCIDAGDPNSPLDPDGTRADMGALPYYHPSAVHASEESFTPASYRLNQNFPNPFNPATTISYAVAKNSHVKLTVYNMLGQVVAVLVDGLKSQGSYYVTWDAKNQPSGLYLCRFEADGFRATKKMFLQK